jgi:four helix bundle protein
MNTIKLEDLEIYQLALEVGDDVWDIVMNWHYFPQKTTGVQFVDAAASISSIIAEGYGRFFYKDRKQFCYYSRGSLMETKNWVTKAFKRKLINKKEHDVLIEKLQNLHHKLNTYIKRLKEK